MGRSIFILFAAFLTPELVADPVLGFQQTDGEAAALSPASPTSVDVSTPTSSTDVPLGPAVDVKLGAPSRTASTSQDLLTALFSNPLSFLLVFLIIFYAVLIIPQQRASRRQQKEQSDRLSSLKKNDRIVTVSGIHAVVTNIDSEAGTITVRIDENSNAKLTIDRDTIRTVLKGA